MACIRVLKKLLWIVVSSSLLAAGCRAPAPTSETGILSNVQQLTSGFDRAGEAYFSPGMRWIIFQATPKGESDYQMYVAPLRWNAQDGSDAGHVYLTPLPMEHSVIRERTDIAGIGEPTRISPAWSKNTCGFFSPDENSLIFASTGPHATPATAPATSTAGYQRSSGTYKWEFPADMEIYRADGWEQAVIAASPLGTNLAQHALTHNDAYDAEDAYSLDGKWIVFTSNRTGDLELFVMRPDGSDIVQLTHTKGYDGGAFFSPDGKRMVYRSDRMGNNLLQIFVADVVYDASRKITGLSRERQITHDNFVNWGPYWHPDGKHIIYATSAHGHTNYELYLIRSDGSHKVRITFTNGFDGLPVFSPDGKYLMWTSKRTKDQTTQIFIAGFTMPRGA